MATHARVIAEASRALANAALVLADALDAEDTTAPGPRTARAIEASEVIEGTPDPDAPPHGFRRNGTGGLERI
jgi:hypothetical protein